MTELAAQGSGDGRKQKLEDLMKEGQDRCEIAGARNPNEDDDQRQTQTQRHTLRSILSIESLRDTGEHRTLLEVLQSENQSRAWEREPRNKEIPADSGSRSGVWKRGLHLRKRKSHEVESLPLLETWNAPEFPERSPSGVDFTRFASPGVRGNNRVSDRALSIFVVAGSENQEPLMMGSGRATKWKAFKDKLSLRSITCCGAPWDISSERTVQAHPTTPAVLPTVEYEESSNSNTEQNRAQPTDVDSDTTPDAQPQPTDDVLNTTSEASTANLQQNQTNNNSEGVCQETEETSGDTDRRQLIAFLMEGSDASEPQANIEAASGGGMNLAAALAAERPLRASQERDNRGSATEERGTSEVPRSPNRVSLLTLLEEHEETQSQRHENVMEMEEEKEKGTLNGVCCVCMVRHKGAAFIPCGHTFCRHCSRELWHGRGSCPLCNRFILEILDIF